MDFTGRDGFYDDQDHINRSTTHFPFSSSSSSVSSSSSPQYRGFFPLSNNTGHTVNYHVQDEEELALASAATTASTSGGAAPMIIEKEHMFDKVVTPSDVGKLNRLVIPKQHAEKYFPLDSTTNEKGLLLNFEDRTGKPWRFRYSYWNSSQSYVMTKGWSRFVKEKKLDAGDIVSFQRGVGEEAKDRLFIDWRRRQNAHPQFDHHQQTSSGFGFHRSNAPWSPLFLRPPHGAVVQFSQQPNNFVNSYQNPNPNQNQNRYNHYYYNNNVNPCPGSIIYLRSTATQVQESGGGSESRVVDVEPMVFDSVPVVHGTSTKTVSKKLRLFGVNMECGVSSEASLQQDESNIPFTTLESTRLYNGVPVQTDHHQSLMNNKGKSSSNSMSLDLDI